MATSKTARAPRKTATKPKSGTNASARPNSAAWSIGAIALAAGAGLVAFLTRGRIAALLASEPAEGHVPTDLLGPDRNADDRAVADFRPDMSAPMTAGERAALQPATTTA